MAGCPGHVPRRVPACHTFTGRTGRDPQSRPGHSNLRPADRDACPHQPRANINRVTSTRATDIDWDELREEAVRAATHAYAPYSRFPVGAAGLTDSGRRVSGCNVENASYGLSWCAECSLVAALVSSGGGRLRAVACRHGAGDLLLPCGRCRQVLFEFGGAELLVDAPGGPRPLGELLVDAFGPADLARASAGEP